MGGLFPLLLVRAALVRVKRNPGSVGGSCAVTQEGESGVGFAVDRPWGREPDRPPEPCRSATVAVTRGGDVPGICDPSAGVR